MKRWDIAILAAVAALSLLPLAFWGREGDGARVTVAQRGTVLYTGPMDEDATTKAATEDTTFSDVELAEFISRIEIGDFGPQVYGKTFCDMCKGQYECDDCRLWWLQQLAEEDT